MKDKDDDNSNLNSSISGSINNKGKLKLNKTPNLSSINHKWPNTSSKENTTPNTFSKEYKTPNTISKRNNKAINTSSLTCLKNTTPEQRKMYCKEEYNGLPALRKKCKA